MQYLITNKKHVLKFIYMVRTFDSALKKESEIRPATSGFHIRRSKASNRIQFCAIYHINSYDLPPFQPPHFVQWSIDPRYLNKVTFGMV
jgi:hypothetical protein